MLDPGLEHLHRHNRLWRVSIERARLMEDAIWDILLLVPVIGLFLFAPEGQWAPAWEVVLIVGACAVAAAVRFDVGTGSAVPVELTMIPLWFAVPPAWLVPLMGAGMVLSGLMEHVIERSEDPPWRRLLRAGDAWPAVGPAIVLALAGAPTASMDVMWVVVAAFAAQVAVDTAVGVLPAWLNHGVNPKMLLRIMIWVVAVDAALAPIGFVTAVISVEHPGAILALLPLVAVIGEFARERRERLDQALQLSTTYRGTAQLMGDVLEADDAYTGGEHTQGVVEMAIAVGLELKLSPKEMRDLEFGALLHDIGKLRVPNEIINKPGTLTAAEWELVRMHPIYGQEMLDRVGGAMTDAGRIVRAHHERWDGNGYPDALRATEIPLAARIITVCDSFSAMTTNRSYSRARPHDEALVELQRCSGSQFDPAAVDALYRVLAVRPDILGAGTIARESVTGSAAVAAAIGFRPST